MILALPRQMQRWRHTSLPLLRCTSLRPLGTRTTQYQSQVYSTLHHLSTGGRNDTPRSNVQDASPLLQIQLAKFSHASLQTPEHTGDSLQLSKQSPQDPLSQSLKAAFPKRRRLYNLRTRSHRNNQLLEDVDHRERGLWAPRVFTTIKPLVPHHKSRRIYKARRKLYTTAHYENYQIRRRLGRSRSSLGARRARLTFILWKISVARAQVWLYRLAPPTRSKLPNLISHSMLQKTTSEIREEWDRRNTNKRVTSRKLGAILLYTLKNYPDFAPRLLEAIFPFVLSSLPHYMIEDTIWMAILRWDKINKAKISESMELEQLTAISRCLEALLRATPKGHIHLRPDASTVLFKNLAPDDVFQIYALLNKKRVYLATQSLLHLASRFAKMNTMTDKSRAVDIMTNLVNDSHRTFNINGAVGASVCTSILKTHEPAQYDKPIHLAQRLLGLGMQPNAFGYNTLIALMWRTGELVTAWAIYRQMARLMKIKDGYVYTNLMLGSLRAGDITSLDQAFSLALKDSLLEAKDWGAFLYVIWSWPTSNQAYPIKIGINRKARFRLMLEVYRLVFDLEPLEHLIGPVYPMLSGDINRLEPHLVRIIEKITSPSDGPLKPTQYILRLMTCAYVRGLGAPFDVLDFYMRFDTLLKDGDPLVTGLMLSDAGVPHNNAGIHNSIIKALCSSNISRPVAYEILRDMLEANPTTASAQQKDPLIAGNHGNGEAAQQDERPRITLPRPNLVTFNIVVNALMFDGLTREAENMLYMMRDQGISPDHVTWNILVRGYARLQDVGGTVRSLQRMEQEGFQSSDRTISGFNMLSAANRELAVSKMELVIEENRKTQLSGESSRRYGTTSSGNDTTDPDVPDTVLDDLQREIEEGIYRIKAGPKFHRGKGEPTE